MKHPSPSPFQKSLTTFASPSAGTLRRETPVRLRFAMQARAAALALGASALLSAHSARAANTEYDVTNGQTDLTAPATYTTGGTAGTGAGGTTAAAGPTVISDVTFDSGTAYSPAAFTLNSSQTFGSLNDLSATALTITSSAADTLTLGGSGDPGSSVPGAAAGDLLYVASGGSLTIGAAATPALGLALGQAGNFDIAGTGAATINSVISGTSGLTMTGAGTLTLSGANTYTGATTISAGTVMVGVAQVGSTSGAFGATNSAGLTLGSGSTLNLNGNSYQMGTLTATATTSLLTSTTAATLTINYSDTTGQYGGLTVGGAASVLLNGGATSSSHHTPFSTTAAVITGTGSIGFENQTGVIRDNYIGINLGTSGSLLFGGTGQFQNTAAQTIGGGVIVNGTGNLWNFQSTTTVNGAWTGSGTLQLQQGSTPTFNFAGNVTGFTGTLQLATGGGGNNATFELTNSTTIGGAAAVWNQQLQATGTTGFNTLEWAGTGSQTIPLGDLNTTGTSSGPGIRLLNATASTTATFQVGALNATSSYSGTIVNGTGTAEVTAITKVGTGAWTLTGANTYTGATSINGTGSLVLGATNTLTATSGITVGTGATLSLAAANALATPGATTSTTMGSPVSVAGQVPITLGGGTLLRNGTGVSLGSQSGTAGTVGIGLLTLTAASTINYGTTGVGTLNFNGLAGASSTNTLSIINYTTTEPPGTVGVDGTDDRLIFNQDVAGFLPDITIDGAATMEVALGNGEFSVITAVPEPSTWTAVLASVGLLGFCLRRKRHLAA